MDGGFWAAIITWGTLGVLAALLGFILHSREKGTNPGSGPSAAAPAGAPSGKAGAEAQPAGSRRRRS